MHTKPRLGGVFTFRSSEVPPQPGDTIHFYKKTSDFESADFTICNTATLKIRPLTVDRWYLAYTQPRQETVAPFNLEQQVFEAYWPPFKQFKKTEQGPVALFEPMFPRYLLFRPGRSGQSISAVRSTKGGTRIVRFGFGPARASQWGRRAKATVARGKPGQRLFQGLGREVWPELVAEKQFGISRLPKQEVAHP